MGNIDTYFFIINFKLELSNHFFAKNFYKFPSADRPHQGFAPIVSMQMNILID